jgi:AraC-like DNA-binding protein
MSVVLLHNKEEIRSSVNASPLSASAINIQHIKPIIKLLALDGISVSKLLEGTHLTPLDLSCIDINLSAMQYQRLVSNAIELAPDLSFAARLGQQAFLNHDSLLACRIMNSRNVEEAMHLLSQYQTLLTNLFTLEFTSGGGAKGFGAFVATPSHNVNKTLPFFIEFLFSIIYSVGKFCIGKQTLPITFEFAYPPPKDTGHYSQFFSTLVKFDRQVNRAIIPTKVLEMPLIFSNHRQAFDNDKQCQALVINKKNTIAERAKQLIHQTRIPELSLNGLSRHLCISPRSLRRHLQDEETSYKLLIESKRRSLAYAMLVHKKLSLQYVSNELGYKDASSFSRAFKRWHGVSPSQVLKTD